MYNRDKVYANESEEERARERETLSDWVCAKEKLMYYMNEKKMQKREVFRQQRERAWESGKCLGHGRLRKTRSEFSRFVPSMLQDPE